MGKLQYPFPLETSKDNGELGAGGQAVNSMKEVIVLACIHWQTGLQRHTLL